jgi:putative transposase
MNTQATSHPYKRHRFPSDIIAHGVWLYFRFYLSYRDVEELLLARGVSVCESTPSPTQTSPSAWAEGCG